MKRNVFFGNFRRVFMTVAVRFSSFVFSVMPYWAYIQTKVHSLLAQAFHDLTSYAKISGGPGGGSTYSCWWSCGELLWQLQTDSVRLCSVWCHIGHTYKRMSTPCWHKHFTIEHRMRFIFNWHFEREEKLHCYRKKTSAYSPVYTKIK